jgi:hypothetical protein
MKQLLIISWLALPKFVLVMTGCADRPMEAGDEIR